MRMFLLCLLLFLPLTAKAACSEHNRDQGACINAPGCHYVGDTCLDCPANSNVNAIGLYCPEGGICNDGTQSDNGLCKCESPFNLSLLGTSNIYDCYAPCAQDSDDYDTTNSCGLRYFDYYNAPAVVCETNNGLEENSAYHIEPLGVDTYGCYKNNRECNRFNAIDYNSNELTGTLERNAIWNPNYNNNNGGYNVSDCRYKSTNEQSTSKHCIRTVFYSPRNYDQHVSNAQEAIQFYTGDSHTTDADSNYYYYYCTSCENGPYYPTNTNATNCANPADHENSGPTYYMACSCEQIPQGYYRRTQWNYEQPVNSNPLDTYYTACPAGKTTLNDIGGMSIGDCKYTRDTKFCDANGCFKITDADSWNWSD